MAILPEERLLSLREFVRVRWLTVALILAALALEIAVARALARGQLDTLTITSIIYTPGAYIQNEIVGTGVTDLIFLLVVAAAVFVPSVLFWRQAVLFSFVFLTIEGFLSNVYYTSPLPLIFKDFVLLGAYAGFLLSPHRARQLLAFPSFLNLPLFLWLLLVVVQFFNPAAMGIAVGLVGVRVLLLYIPLMYIAYELFQTKRGIVTFATFLMMLTVPVVLFGIWQFLQGPAFLLHLGPGFRRAIFYVQGNFFPDVNIYRPSSTFSSPAFFAIFLFNAFILCLPFTQFRSLIRRKWFFRLAFLIIMAGILVSGQRSVLVVAPLVLLGFFFAQRFRGFVSTLVVPMLAASLVLLFLPAGQQAIHKGEVVGSWTTPAIQVVLDRLGTTYVTSHKETPGLWLYLTENVASNLGSIFYSSPLGLGTGVATGAARWATGGILVSGPENYYTKVSTELGWPGLALILWILGALLAIGFRTYRSLRDPELRAVSAALIGMHLGYPILFLGAAWMDYSVTSMFFWLAAGIQMKLPALEGNLPQPSAPSLI